MDIMTNGRVTRRYEGENQGDEMNDARSKLMTVASGPIRAEPVNHEQMLKQESKPVKSVTFTPALRCVRV